MTRCPLYQKLWEAHMSTREGGAA